MAAALITAATVAFLTAQGGSSDVLQGISAEDLAAQGITLEEPAQGSATAITMDRATELARGSRAGASVREVRLVRLIDKHRSPATDKIAWAVNFDPQTVLDEPVLPYFPDRSPSSVPAQYQTQYSVAFVDPQTGEVFFSISVTHGN